MLVMQKLMTNMTYIVAAPVSKKQNALLLRATCVVMTTWLTSQALSYKLVATNLLEFGLLLEAPG
jgi:hypothetical protein